MKHVGQLLKKHIEDNHLKKKEIAEAAGISYNYLSTIFKNASCDAALLEKLYVAAGLHPAVVFDVPESVTKQFSDIMAQAILGNASVQITNNDSLRDLLVEKDRVIAEKERVIQLLLMHSETNLSGQNRDK